MEEEEEEAAAVAAAPGHCEVMVSERQMSLLPPDLEMSCRSCTPQRRRGGAGSSQPQTDSLAQASCLSPQTMHGTEHGTGTSSHTLSPSLPPVPVPVSVAAAADDRRPFAEVASPPSLHLLPCLFRSCLLTLMRMSWDVALHMS